jgi:hypothetical protein
MATPMTPERFQDRWEAFKGEPQQVSGIWGLYSSIAELEGSGDILDEQATWALKFSEKPPAPPAPSGGLDPRGSEEAGLVGPKIAAPVKPGDSYLLVNDRDQDMEAFDHTGKLLWKVPCLARGQGADNDWTRTSTDTPPGLYKLGQLYPDYGQNPNPPCSDTAMSYGWYSFDLVELQQQEIIHAQCIPFGLEVRSLACRRMGPVPARSCLRRSGAMVMSLMDTCRLVAASGRGHAGVML